MPFGDRTGPLGQGPMTGRARGLCAGYAPPGKVIAARGGGMGRGSRGGFGMRNRFRAARLYAGEAAIAAPAAASELRREIAVLESAVSGLLIRLDGMRKRVEKFEAAPNE